MSTSARASMVLNCAKAASLEARDTLSPVLAADYSALDTDIRASAKTTAANLEDLLTKLRHMQQLLSQRGEGRENNTLPTWTEYYERFRSEFSLEMSLRTVQRKFRDMDGKPKALPAPKSPPLILSAHDRRRLIEAAAVGNDIVTAWERGGNIEEAVKEYKKIAMDSEKLSDIVTGSEIAQAEPQAAPGEDPVSSLVQISADDLNKFVLKIASRDLGYYGAKFAIYPWQHATEICAIYRAIRELCERKFRELGRPIDVQVLEQAAALQSGTKSSDSLASVREELIAEASGCVTPVERIRREMRAEGITKSDLATATIEDNEKGVWEIICDLKCGDIVWFREKFHSKGEAKKALAELRDSPLASAEEVHHRSHKRVCKKNATA